MKQVKIAVIVSIILLIVFGGVVIYTISGTDSPNNNTTDDTPSFNDENNGDILSDSPTGITEKDNTIEIESDKLINAHTNILKNNSVTVSKKTDEYSTKIKTNNEQIYSIKETNQDDTEKYSNGEYTLSSVDSIYSGNHEPIDTKEYTKETKFNSFVKNLDVDTFSETENGNTKIDLKEGDNVDSLENIYGFESINSVRVSLIITPDGLIKNADVEVIGTINGVNDFKSESYEFSDIDNTNVQEPDWISSAENSVSLIDGDYDIYSGWILIQHDGLATIPEGQTLEIRNLDTNDVQTVELPSDFSEDDNLGLSLQSDGEWIATINETPPDGENNDVSGYEIRSENNGQEIFNIRVKS